MSSDAVERDRLRSWWQRIKARLGGSVHVQGTIAAPTAQHYERTEDEKWQDVHGCSAATTPAPWTADITAHNAAVDKEYRDEIEARKAAMLVGEYTPRFVKASVYETDDRLQSVAPKGVYRVLRDGRFVRTTAKEQRCYELASDAWIDGILVAYVMGSGDEVPRGVVDVIVGRPDELVVVYAFVREVLHPDDIDWDLELSAVPGRRTNVTKDAAKRMEALTGSDLAHAIEIGNLSRAVHAAEVKAHTPRAIVGSRASILAAVGGNEEAADQVEASARRHFGVDDLDAPFQAEVKKDKPFEFDDDRSLDGQGFPW